MITHTAGRDIKAQTFWCTDEKREPAKRNTPSCPRDRHPKRDPPATDATVMSQSADEIRSSELRSRLPRPHPFSVVSLMCDHGLHKSNANQAAQITSNSTKTDAIHKFSVESLLQQKNSTMEEEEEEKEKEEEKSAYEHLKRDSKEEKAIEDNFSWLNTSRYNPASEYRTVSLLVFVHMQNWHSDIQTTYFTVNLRQSVL